MGAYTSSTQRALNTSIDEKRMRSAKPPTMRAGVMMAKVSWNRAKEDSGMAPLMASSPTPAKKALPKPPTKALPSAKARL